MKRLILALWLVLSTAVYAQSPQVKLEWDANAPAEQVTKYTLYEQVGTVWNKLIDVDAASCTATTCSATLNNVQPGVHTYAVTAGNKWGESDRSNTVATPPPSTAPKNVKVIIIIQISG